MAISLYELSIPGYLQTLGAVSGFLDRSAAYFNENGTDLGSIVETRLYADMLPFSFQILSVAHHSRGAIEGIKAGVFHPPPASAPLDYAGLQAVVADARAALEAVTPQEVNALEGRDVIFQFGEMKMPFTAEGFILSFSQPNFHFHATTAYDILRSKGAPLGKRNYMGKLRMKT